jgi:hypothetical protein
MSYGNYDDRLTPRRSPYGQGQGTPRANEPVSPAPSYGQANYTQPQMPPQTYAQPTAGDYFASSGRGSNGGASSSAGGGYTPITRAASPYGSRQPQQQQQQQQPYLAPGNNTQQAHEMAAYGNGSHSSDNLFQDTSYTQSDYNSIVDHYAAATSPSHAEYPSADYNPARYSQGQDYAEQPRPSMSYSDYPDETKSFTSTTHINKEWEVGSVVPPVPQMSYNAQMYGQPSPSLMGYPPQRPGYGQNPYGAPSPTPSYNYGGTSHWHAMREQLLKRRVVKQIPLRNGNLIMDVPVPKGVIPSTSGLSVEQDEMTKLRYSAATCDPDDFMRNKFTLRPYLYGRKTELFIVMTMYNENSELFLRTLNAVIKNIAHLATRSRSKTWGAESWKKIVVCIVADGRKVVDPRVLKVLQLMGVYAEVRLLWSLWLDER